VAGSPLKKGLCRPDQTKRRSGNPEFTVNHRCRNIVASLLGPAYTFFNRWLAACPGSVSGRWAVRAQKRKFWPPVDSMNFPEHEIGR
jgi:hypothetical protein